MDQFLGIFEGYIGNGQEPLDAAMSAIRDTYAMSANIHFEGDAYTEEWHLEAERRGLIKARTIPEGIDLYKEPKTMEMLEKLGVFKKKEIEAFWAIRMEAFINSLEIEMSLLRDMIWEGVLPAISNQLLLERGSLAAAEAVGADDLGILRDHTAELASLKAKLLCKATELQSLKDEIADLDLREHAEQIVARAVPLMDEIRAYADKAETYLSKENIPYPRYRSLLSLSA